MGVTVRTRENMGKTYSIFIRSPLEGTVDSLPTNKEVTALALEQPIQNIKPRTLKVNLN